MKLVYVHDSFFANVLVYHDLLGMRQHPHHAKVTPKFRKKYARIGDVINKAFLQYKEEVTNGSFPGPSHTPYKMNPKDAEAFTKELQKLGFDVQHLQQLMQLLSLRRRIWSYGQVPTSPEATKTR
ncbi:hypothetical protein GQ457_07G025270 [Hibiscus cannabinus]